MMEAKTSVTREAPASWEVLRHQEHGKDRSSSAWGTTTSSCSPSPPPPPTSPAGGRRGRSACSSRKLRGLKPHVQGYLRRKSLKKICHPRYSQFKPLRSLKGQGSLEFLLMPAVMSPLNSAARPPIDYKPSAIQCNQPTFPTVQL